MYQNKQTFKITLLCLQENFYRGFQFPDDVRESGSDVPPNNSRDYIPPNKSQDRKKYKATVFEVSMAYE